MAITTIDGAIAGAQWPRFITKSVTGTLVAWRGLVADARAHADAFNLKLAARRGVEALADFRLLWDSLGQALAGRDKIVIDAEGVRGRRNLWLFPPEWMRLPAPAPRPARNEPEAREP